MLPSSQSSSRSLPSSSSSRTPSDTVTDAATTTTTSPTHSAEFSDHRVLSLVYANGCVGASYYTQDFLAVRVMPQLEDRGCFLQRLEPILYMLQPRTIIISRAAHRALVSSVDSFVSFNKGAKIERVPPQQMLLETAKQELMNLNIPGQPGVPFLDRTQDEKMIYLNSILDFSQENSLRTVGALLQYVKAHFQDLDNVVIASLRMHRGCGYLSVSMRTLRDLHILAEESHPCSLQGDAHRTREGSSVFSLFERNCTIGRARLRSFFVAPLNQANTINDSLNSIEYLASLEHYSLPLHEALSKIRRVDRILIKMLQGQTTVPEWRILSNTAYDLIVVQHMLEVAPNPTLCTVLQRAREASCEDTCKILSMIENTIDFEAFQESSPFTSPIRAGICSYLDEKKRLLFGGLHKKLTELTRTELANMPANVSTGRIIYLPCWGFVFATPAENEENVKRLNYTELVCKLDLEVLFRTSITRRLDREYGDLSNIIIHRENKICRTLQMEVLDRSWQMLKVIENLCDLDAVLAMAMTARDRGFTRPTITEQSAIFIRNGFHPLLELNKPLGVVHIQPNSFKSSESISVGVVTGANSCGKSVYLRQNALIVFLAHVGSFVPAEESRIGLLDTIQTSFFIDETMQDQASSFALQCRQIAVVERNIEACRALVVIDEYGKGTNTAEGAGLCVAFLEKLMNLPSNPHVIFASHYYKHLYHFLRHCPRVHFITFRYIFDRDNLIQLHEAVEGISSRSFGGFAAREADLPPEIISMQERIAECLEHSQEVRITGESNLLESLRFVNQALEETKTMLTQSRDLRHGEPSDAADMEEVFHRAEN